MTLREHVNAERTGPTIPRCGSCVVPRSICDGRDTQGGPAVSPSDNEIGSPSVSERDTNALSRDMAVGAVGAIPVLGSLLQPLTARLLDAVRDEHARNASISLRSAERVSGLSREDLQRKIAEEPRLVPLLTRVLVAAGLTGYDDLLDAMGAALGEAVGDTTKIDEAEVLLIAIADLRAMHVHVLRIAKADPPLRYDDGKPIQSRWGINTLAPEANLSIDLTSLCVSALVSAGLLLQDGDVFGGPGYYISDLGRTVPDVLRVRGAASA
jgi:hypothetical protein